MRPRLSAAMIVRDEAVTLEGCLRSLVGLADEVVVVDTGSADGTPELAARLGARVFAFPWGGDFAAAQAKCQSERQTNRAENQNECPDDDLGSDIEDFKNSGDHKDRRADIGRAADGAGLFQAGVGARSTGHGF